MTYDYADPPKRTRDDFDPEDLAALDRALELALADIDPGRVEQVRSMLDDDWGDTVLFASYYRQCDHLQLSPWEVPPCCIAADKIDEIIARGAHHNNEFGSAKLLKKMIAAGVSSFDPSPIESIAAAKQRST